MERYNKDLGHLSSQCKGNYKCAEVRKQRGGSLALSPPCLPTSRGKSLEGFKVRRLCSNTVFLRDLPAERAECVCICSVSCVCLNLDVFTTKGLFKFSSMKDEVCDNNTQ